MWLEAHETHAVGLWSFHPPQPPLAKVWSGVRCIEGMGKDWFLFTPEKTCALFLPLKTPDLSQEPPGLVLPCSSGRVSLRTIPGILPFSLLQLMSSALVLHKQPKLVLT